MELFFTTPLDSQISAELIPELIDLFATDADIYVRHAFFHSLSGWLAGFRTDESFVEAMVDKAELLATCIATALRRVTSNSAPAEDSSPNMRAKELASLFMAIASCAAALEVRFAVGYDAIFPLLRPIILGQYPDLGDDPDNYEYVTQWLLEASTLLLSCVGSEKVDRERDVVPIVNLLKRGMSPDLPRESKSDVRFLDDTSFAELAWSRMGPLMGQDFKEHLPYVMSSVLQTLEEPHNSRVVDLNNEDVNEEQFVYVQSADTGDILAVPRAEVDAKERAVARALMFFENSQLLVPYLDRLFRLSLENSSNLFSKGTSLALSDLTRHGVEKLVFFFGFFFLRRF
jgi:hypothetical protein